MPNYKPKKGRPFEPGKSGNPRGSSEIARQLGDVKHLNKLKVAEILNRFMTMSLDEVMLFANNKSNPAVEVLVASIIVFGIKHGDQSRLTFLLDRLLGKPKEEIEHTFLGNINTALVDKIAEIEKSKRTGGQHNGNEKSMRKESVEKNGLQTGQEDDQKIQVKEKDELPW